MTDTFNDRYRVNMILTVLFIVGIGASLYMIYSLPASLRVADGYQPGFLKVYLVVGITFLVGALTLTWALRYKKEVLVFRDRTADAQAERDAADQSGRTTISLDTVKASLQSRDKKEALLAGLTAICKQLEAGQGALYEVKETEGKRRVELKTGYALSIGESKVISFEFGEGLIGQAAASGRTLYIDDVPDGYITILSGLGSASPRFLLIVPVKKAEQVTGILEIASFTKVTEDQRKFVEESAQLISEKISSQA